MANFVADPRPFVPKGFVLDDVQPSPLLRHEVYVTGCYNKTNEDLAIAKLSPPVHKEDFHLLARELKAFFRDVHQVYGTEISPCPIGDAFIKFNNPFERDRFLGPNFMFGYYSLHFVRHDEAENARAFPIDREAMILILAYPEDLRYTQHVVRAVSQFGILIGWDDTQPGCVTAKVYLNDDVKIPSSIKLISGLPPNGKSWTSPCYILKRSNVTLLPDEEGFVTIGPLHPFPTPAPRWEGPVPPANPSASPILSATGGSNSPKGKEEGQGMKQGLEAEVGEPGPVAVASIFADRYQPIPPGVNRDSPRIKSVVVGTTWKELSNASPVKLNLNLDISNVFNYISKSPASSIFIFLNLLDINPDLPIPPYFCDFLTVAWLAFLIPDQDMDVTPTRAELLEITEEEVLEISGNQFTQKKRKISKTKQQMHDRHLRRSKRSAIKQGGFKKDVLHPVPLTMVPASPKTSAPEPAPYLPSEVAQGIATGFLQIHPSDVSAAIFKKDVDGI